LKEFIDAVERSKARGLRLCTHLILGFPTESRQEILETPLFLNRLGIDGAKLHNLHVIKNTVLEQIYRAGGFTLRNLDAYLSLLANCLERRDSRQGKIYVEGAESRAQPINGYIRGNIRH
jgi:radical SAM superfamily enzyme